MKQLGVLIAGITFCSVLSAADNPSQFPQLLDELERAATPMDRGFDQGINAFNKPGNRVVWFTLKNLRIGTHTVAVHVRRDAAGEASGRLQLVSPAGIVSPLMHLCVSRIVRRRAEREAHYDSLDPGSEAFVAADRRNFILTRDDTEEASVSRKRSLWTGGMPNRGSVRFTLRSGGRRRFIVVNDQDIGQVERALVGLLGADRVRNPVATA